VTVPAGAGTVTGGLSGREHDKGRLEERRRKGWDGHEALVAVDRYELTSAKSLDV